MQPQIIFNAHKEPVVNIAAVNSDSNLKRLTELCDQVEVHIRVLEALLRGREWIIWEIPLLMEKAPANLSLMISKLIGKGEWVSHPWLLKEFDSEIEARKRCELIEKKLSDPAITTVKSSACWAIY